MKEPIDKRTKAYKEWLKWKSLPRGLGDTLEKLFQETGVKRIVDWMAQDKDCGCDGRKKWLNKLAPYKKNQVFNYMVESEIEWWTDFLKRHERSLAIADPDIFEISRLHLRLFKRHIKVCRGCGSKELLRAINRIHIVYETYR